MERKVMDDDLPENILRESMSALPPSNKGKVMRSLLVAWERHNSLRLGQFLTNVAFSAHTDLFNISDEQLLEAVKEYDKKFGVKFDGA